jgi:hypothetical protein
MFTRWPFVALFGFQTLVMAFVLVLPIPFLALATILKPLIEPGKKHPDQPRRGQRGYQTCRNVHWLPSPV